MRHATSEGNKEPATLPDGVPTLEVHVSAPGCSVFHAEQRYHVVVQGFATRQESADFNISRLSSWNFR